MDKRGLIENVPLQKDIPHVVLFTNEEGKLVEYAILFKDRIPDKFTQITCSIGHYKNGGYYREHVIAEELMDIARKVSLDKSSYYILESNNKLDWNKIIKCLVILVAVVFLIVALSMGSVPNK